MPQFLERFPEVGDGGGFYKGLMTAMIEAGALIGALNQGWIADKLSRKYSIAVAVIIFIIGSILQTTAVDYAMLTFARFVGGVGIGMLSMVVPLFISEISPPTIRGTLLVLEELSIVTGIVIAFWTTYGTLHIPNEWSWRLPFLIQILPGLVLGVGIVFLPFSPRWLCSKDRDDEALVALSKLRQLPPTDRRIQREWFDIRAEVALHADISAERHPHLQERTTGNRIKLEIVGWTDLFRSGCWRRTFVGTGLMFFQQVSHSTLHIRLHLSDNHGVVRRNQRFDILRPDAILNDGPRIQHAAYHVRRAELRPARRCGQLFVDDGQDWPSSTAHVWQFGHVPLAPDHLNLGRQVLTRLAVLPS
jgi:MFS family permease